MIYRNKLCPMCLLKMKYLEKNRSMGLYGLWIRGGISDVDISA